VKTKTTAKPKYSLFNNIVYVIKMQLKINRMSLVWLVMTIPFDLVLAFLGIYLPKLAVQAAMSGTDYKTFILRLAVIFAAMIVCQVLSSLVGNRQSVSSIRFLNRMIKNQMKKCLLTDYENIESQDFRTLMDRSDQILWRSGGLSAVERISVDLNGLILNVLKYFLFSAVLSFANPFLVVYLTVMPVLNFFAAKYVQKFQFQNKEEMSVLDKRLWYIANIGSSFDASKDIRIYGLTDWIIQKYRDTMKRRMSWNIRVARKNFMASFADIMLILLRDGLAYFILISMTLKNQITVDNFVLYLGAVGSYASMIGGIISTFSDMSGISFQLNDYREFENYAEKGNRSEGADMPEGNEGCAIRVENLDYKYSSADENTLSDISFDIKPGENISIVGLNGAGKTTLVKVLCGLYSPTRGNVYVNGKNMKDYNIYRYYSLFSAVFQDFTFLPLSIMSNVSCTSEDKSDEERVKWALKMAGIYDKVMSLEEGIHTKLDKQMNEHGIDLSGGEKQKLLIARAIYRDAPILILDEPTAALDAMAERELYQRYAELSKGKTTIYISHRLASAQFCDRIFVMNHGEIAEVGTHDELLKAGGLYSEMFEKQSSYYV
jgi:ABC transporter related